MPCCRIRKMARMGAGVGSGWYGTVGEDLVVVLFFFVPNTHFGMLDIRRGCRQGDGDLDAVGVLESKIFGDEGHQVGTVAPEELLDVGRIGL